jgi:cell wall-associated NlpC family hydrolase
VAKRIATRIHFRRGAALVVVLAAACGLAVYGVTGAGAAPTPSISQVQKQVNSLQAQVDKVDQQYDGAGQQLAAAKTQLAQVTKETDRAEAQYKDASAALARIAIAQYENANQTSILGLLTSGDPTAVLSQASLLMQIVGSNNELANQFLTVARELSTIQQQHQQTEEAVAQITAQLSGQKTSLTKLLDSRQSLLSSLTAAQAAQVEATTVGAGGTTSATYTGPTTTQADKAVQFAYDQLGCPYVYGATGPCNDGFDCSGLTQAAWAAAGVPIPRTTYEDWADLPHIPLADIQPGDLLLYNGEGHVAMYVGVVDGTAYIIDAPHTGADVERIPMDESWYEETLDGVVRP